MQRLVYKPDQIDNKTNSASLVNYLEGVIGDEIILNSFIRDLKIVTTTPTYVLIEVNSRQAIELINSEYKEVFQHAIEIVFNKVLDYKLRWKGQQISPVENVSPAVSKNINPRFNFANYVVSKFNHEVVKIAQKIITNVGRFSPFYVSSKSGLGKTHLLHAIANQAILNGNSVIYIEPNKFTRDVTQIVRKNQDIVSFTENFLKYDFLLFDDIQNLGDRNVTLGILFNIINRHIEEQKQIVICSDKLPNELSGFEERFITRFSSGISSIIQEPEIDDLIKVLEFKIKQENLNPEQWEKDAIRFIAQNNAYSIRSLEGAVKRVLFFAESNSKIKYTYTVISNIFKDLGGDLIEMTPLRVLNVICDYYKINRKDLVGKSRKKNFVAARHMAIWLIRKINKLSFNEIGKIFGGRDHSTIIFSVKNIDHLMSINKTIKIAARNIENRIKNNV
ncbi:DnaA ATPase domain-containing protein [Mycoplasma sp. ATU-Cv-703]|uniref:DnaA ATPase domain-containing protein n=1 Tax=Mycoplasma sp. ATU-Cv-703 TaxID=2498595 RepID=UPI000FDEA4EC